MDKSQRAEKQYPKQACALHAGAPIGSGVKSRHCGLGINLHLLKKLADPKAEK